MQLYSVLNRFINHIIHMLHLNEFWITWRYSKYFA
jgi:hypothetical protein